MKLKSQLDLLAGIISFNNLSLSRKHYIHRFKINIKGAISSLIDPSFHFIGFWGKKCLRIAPFIFFFFFFKY